MAGAELAGGAAVSELEQRIAALDAVLHDLSKLRKARASDADEIERRAWKARANLLDSVRALQLRAEAAEKRAVCWTPVGEALPAAELRVLAVYNDGRATMILRALYTPPRTVLCYEDFEGAEYDEESDAIYYPGGWYEAMEEGEYAFIGPLLGTVTHWSQLPALPGVPAGAVQRLIGEES